MKYIYTLLALTIIVMCYYFIARFYFLEKLKSNYPEIYNNGGTFIPWPSNIRYINKVNYDSKLYKDSYENGLSKVVFETYEIRIYPSSGNVIIYKK
jgi:hypothetical protein